MAVPRIALVVDNPFRDLPGLVLVAASLAARGARCHLVPMARQDVELRALEPDAVVLNYLRPNNEALARGLVRSGAAVVVLDTEGGILQDLDAYNRSMAPDREVHAGLAAFLAWGPVLAEYLVERGWYRKSQVVVTGSPRFDFYASPWRAAALARSASSVIAREPLVLINGNFSLSNPRFQTPEQEARTLVEVFGEDANFVARWQKLEVATRTGLVNLVRRLAGHFPDVSFVYRPHPFERIETYDGELDAYPNATVEKRGTVDAWILRSAAVIQRTCTTAVEAGMAGVPALSPDWLPSAVPIEAADSASIGCDSPEALERRLEEALAGTIEMPEPVRAALDDTITRWFHRVDGEAHERVAAVLLAALPQDGRRDFDAIGLPPPTNAVANGLKARSRRLVKALLPPGIGGLRPTRTDRPWRPSDKSFDVSDVRGILDCLAVASPELVRDLDVASARVVRDYRGFLRFGRSTTIWHTER